MAFQHKKKYGQNFLTRQTEILAKIMEVSEVNSEDCILEIGPGEGALTELLLQEAKSVLNIEIDEDLKPILQKKFGNIEKYRLVMGDVLEVNFAEYMQERTKVDKIKAIRAMREDIEIEVDGGITDATIQSCIEAGATTFVAGSYVFSGNYAERIANLKNKK